MTVDTEPSPSSQPPLKTQTTLTRFFQRYQPSGDLDTVALLRSRAIQEAERRTASPKSQSAQDLSLSDTQPVTNVVSDESVTEPMVASALTDTSETLMHSPLDNQSPASDTLGPTPQTNAESRQEGNTTAQQPISELQNLKRKEPASSPNKVDAQDGSAHHPAKRSRSTSAEPIPHLQQATQSSTSLSTAPPTSQLSVPSSLNTLSFGLSQEMPIYVPSSQSDENYSSDEVVSAPTALPRVVINTKEEDPANDSDSDSESLSSLEDLSEILKPFKPRTQRAAPITRSHNRPNRFSSTSLLKPQVNGKYSLSNLIKQHNRDVTAQAEVSRAQSVLAESVGDREGARVTVGNVDKSLLATIVKQEDPEDEVDKLLHAMNRADVLNTEVAWHFFDHDVEEVDARDVPSFPRLHGDLAKFNNLFNDEASRKIAFLTGFAREILSTLPHSLELRDWLWEAALLEPAEDLAEAYIAAQKSMEVDPRDIKKLFDHLKANSAVLDFKYDIKPIQKNINGAKRRHPTGLPRVLNMLAKLSSCFIPSALSYALLLLLRMAVDAEIVNDAEVRLKLHECITVIVSNLPENQAEERLLVTSRQFVSMTSPILQNRLLSSIPSTTPRIHLFKRRLALAFFLSSHFPLQANLTSTSTTPNIPDAIIVRLKTDPTLQTSDANLDYRALAASISILDVAIDSGFPSRSRAAHDATIDALISHVHVLFARIVDSGASHLARTEAKAVLERLLYRLDFAVRSVPREAKGGLLGAARTMHEFWRPKTTAEPQGEGDDDEEEEEEEAYVTADEEG